MRVLDRDGIFVSRHQTRPNAAGLQYFKVRVVKLFTDAEHYEVVVAYRPIDDIVKEEKARQTLLKEALAAAQRANAAKSNFLFNMSHDIRTP